jgi:hypothetical protein
MLWRVFPLSRLRGAGFRCGYAPNTHDLVLKCTSLLLHPDSPLPRALHYVRPGTRRGRFQLDRSSPYCRVWHGTCPKSGKSQPCRAHAFEVGSAPSANPIRFDWARASACDVRERLRPDSGFSVALVFRNASCGILIWQESVNSGRQVYVDYERGEDLCATIPFSMKSRERSAN